VVVIPEDVQEALSNHPQAGEFFEKLAYSHRKEYMFWVESAKRAETRHTRIIKMIELLKEGKKGPSSW
jgi:uncharacterized protein YdeI (YjbR/CyaY-like superfamily)